MARVKKAMNARKKHKKILKLAKGFRGSRSKLYRPANTFVMKALKNAYIGRKLKNPVDGVLLRAQRNTNVETGKFQRRNSINSRRKILCRFNTIYQQSILTET